MRSFPLHHNSFPEILLLLEKSRSDLVGTSTVLFNKTKQRFEYYNNEEKDLSKTDIYIHAEDAIAEYEGNRIVRETALSQVQSAQEGNATSVDEEFVDRFTNEADDETFDPPESPPFFSDIDDSELLESTNHNLEILKSIKNKQNTELREKLLRVISNLYGYDMITESDVAMAIVETGELKKILSMLFSILGTKVSSTRVSADLKVSSGELTFIPKIEYHLEDYRRAAAQCLVDVKRLAEARTALADRDKQIRDLTRDLAEERRKIAESVTTLATLTQERDAVRELKPVEPIEYVVCYMTDKGLRYIYPIKDRQTDDGVFPTKYLNSTSQRSKAYKFSLEQAQIQVARIVKHRGNVKFVDIAAKGTKEVTEMFAIHRILIEKMDIVKQEEIKM